MHSSVFSHFPPASLPPAFLPATFHLPAPRHVLLTPPQYPLIGIPSQLRPQPRTPLHSLHLPPANSTNILSSRLLTLPPPIFSTPTTTPKSPLTTTVPFSAQISSSKASISTSIIASFDFEVEEEEEEEVGR